MAPSFLVFEFELRNRPGLNCSQFAYKPEVSRKSQKLSVFGNRRFGDLPNLSFQESGIEKYTFQKKRITKNRTGWEETPL